MIINDEMMMILVYCVFQGNLMKKQDLLRSTLPDLLREQQKGKKLSDSEKAEVGVTGKIYYMGK
jgi:hypothetical protein